MEPKDSIGAINTSKTVDSYDPSSSVFSFDRLLLQKCPERRKQLSDEHQDPNAAAKHVVIGKQSLPAGAGNIMTRKKFKSDGEGDPRCP